MINEYESIFVESSEELGILFTSYKPVFDHLSAFLKQVEDVVNDVNEDPSSVDENLSDSIKKFKEDIVVEKNPEPIKISTIKKTENTIKSFRNDLDKVLNKYASVKKKVKYGGSSISALIHRPKVYSNDINADNYEKVGKIIRDINRSLDWIEKCIIDLYAFVSQDLDLLNVIDRVYAKNDIYENALPAGIIDEDVATSVIQMLPGSTGESVSTKAISNTANKKTGQAPKYISDNHDMAKYGEDDIKKDDKVKEVTLDDYKRPSAEDDEPKPENKYEPDDDPSPIFDDKKEDDVPKSNGTTNYYYYTYTNSMNKHSHDDHSVHDSHDNNSTNINNADTKKEKDKSFKALESAPWELNLGFGNIALMEDGGQETKPNPDDSKPKSDHPVMDTFMDIDRKTTKVQQDAKRVVQNTQNVGRAAVKPVNRTIQWVGSVISDWKDKDENKIKEDMADPKTRSRLFNAIKKSITVGALWQAGLLLNPVFIALSALRKFDKDRNKFRLRNEMIGELKTEMQVIDEKIKDADSRGDNKAKYQLMRFKNEINKKLMRVGGDETGVSKWSRIL